MKRYFLRINEAIEKTKIYIGFDNLNSAIRGGRVKPIIGSICNF